MDVHGNRSIARAVAARECFHRSRDRKSDHAACGHEWNADAAATITAAVKDVKVKQTGYSGLMLPILEDSRLAQRWSEGHISIDALLSYSAVCGTA